MDDTELQNYITDEVTDEYSDALEAVPAEVRRFMWSDAFKTIITTIGKAAKLDGRQTEIVKEIAIETLMETITPIARRAKLSSVGIDQELQDTILEAINDEIVSRALNQVEIETDLSVVESIENKIELQENTDAPSPTEALLSIQERLSKPTAIAPIKRDYSLEKPAANSTPAQKPTFDIYREVPEK